MDWQATYDALPDATALPSGTYDGRAYPVPAWPAWRGKVFDGARVVNRLGPFRAVSGAVELVDGEVVIRYPLGLTDRLRPASADRWLGYLDLGRRRRLWFTLERREDT